MDKTPEISIICPIIGRRLLILSTASLINKNNQKKPVLLNEKPFSYHLKRYKKPQYLIAM
jgi:hypothetical protein